MALNPIGVLLSRPFPPEEIQWVPLSIHGARALVAPYIDVRSVQQRLDQVVGADHWEDSYRIVHGRHAVCQLSVLIREQWITKCDIGAATELLREAKQEASWWPRWFGRRLTDEPAGHLLKAAFSDALKRAAVKFGIGRYLRDCCKVWVEWDPYRREIVKPPAAAVLSASKINGHPQGETR